MDGKIDGLGALHIKRVGHLKIMYCPFVYKNYGGIESCSDNCPHFGEPFHGKYQNEKTTLHICNDKTMYFDKFEDERINDTKN